MIASGGTDYYDKASHEWYDTVMAIYDYETKAGKVRAFYQTQTTNGSQGYFENFMGAVIDRMADAILHDPRLRKLEGTWRGLAWLVDGCESGTKLKVKVMQASWEIGRAHV